MRRVTKPKKRTVTRRKPIKRKVTRRKPIKRKVVRRKAPMKRKRKPISLRSGDLYGGLY